MAKRHPDQQWKKAERFLARLFGSDRRALSGGSNANTAEGSDDSCHENLYLESKYAKYHPVYRLYLKCRAAVQAEAKRPHRRGKVPRIPVIGLRQHNLEGCLLVVHSSDLPRLVEEYMKANPPDPISSPKKSPPRGRKPT